MVAVLEFVVVFELVAAWALVATFVMVAVFEIVAVWIMVAVLELVGIFRWWCIEMVAMFDDGGCIVIGDCIEDGGIEWWH